MTGCTDLPARREPLGLRAGALECELDGLDLRYVRLGEKELLRRLHATVRDPEWRTIEGAVRSIHVHRADDSFTVDLAVRHAGEGIAVSWEGSFSGDPSGRIEAVFEATAEQDFEYARIGLCVLHPIAETRGRPYRARTPTGWIAGTLPDLIGEQGWKEGFWVPLFPPFDSLEIDLGDGTLCRFEFEGDLWETEDHRNWTDASLKTYCTPLSLGGPHRLKAGEAIRQRVVLTVAGARRAPRHRPRGDTVSVTIGNPAHTTVPAVGTAMTGGLSDANLDQLRALRPVHLRIDLDTTRRTWRQRVGELLSLARGFDVEVALYTDQADHEELAALADLLAGAAIARLLVFKAGGEIGTPEECTPAGFSRRVRSAFGSKAPPLYAGTDHNFGELNRTRPSLEAIDGLCYPIVAQVHAFDDRSLMEEFPAQHDTVVSARAIAPALPIAVSPVTLRPRPDDRPTSDPSGGDPRQATAFAAAWTIGSIAALARAGANSVTYYEAAGPRGLVPASGNASTAAPYPVYHALAEAVRLHGAAVLNCAIDDELAIAALAARPTSEHLIVLLANLRSSPTQVAIDGAAGAAQMRYLGDRVEPASFSLPGRLTLPPLAIVRIDLLA